MGIIDQILSYEWDGYDWKKRLRETPQNPDYHAEGDVLTHTLMVLEQLLKQKEYAALSPKDQRILLLAALLHDIAKPFCTRREGGRITAHRHARKGAIEARRLFYLHGFMEDLFGQLNFEEREAVCSLIRYHGLPLFFMDREGWERDLFKASLETNLSHLTLLATADVLGRIGKSKGELLERIALFKESCSELGCWDGAKTFLSDRSRLLYFKQGEQYLHYEPHTKTCSRAFLLSGIPASGKDTYIEHFLPETPLISLDALRDSLGVLPEKNQGRVIQEGKRLAKESLARKQDFVWNATNITLQMRTALIDLCLSYGASVHLIYCETPFKTALARNAARKRPLPQKAIWDMANKLEVPKLWEAESLIYHIHS